MAVITKESCCSVLCHLVFAVASPSQSLQAPRALRKRHHSGEGKFALRRQQRPILLDFLRFRFFQQEKHHISLKILELISSVTWQEIKEFLQETSSVSVV